MFELVYFLRLMLCCLNFVFYKFIKRKIFFLLYMYLCNYVIILLDDNVENLVFLFVLYEINFLFCLKVNLF